MKCVINGLDMDSGLDAWRAKFAADGGNQMLVRKRVQLSCGRSYSLEEYQRAQRRGTEWMAGSAGHAGASATQSVRMLAYIGQCMTPTERRKKNPGRGRLPRREGGVGGRAGRPGREPAA